MPDQQSPAKPQKVQVEKAVTGDAKDVPPAEIVTDTAPKLGDDGRVYVSDAISQAAEDQGHGPDLQPRAHPDQTVMRASEEDLKQAAHDHAMAVVALDAIQAPLSIKVEQAKAGKSVEDVVAEAEPEISKAVEDGTLTAPAAPNGTV